MRPKYPKYLGLVKRIILDEIKVIRCCVLTKYYYHFNVLEIFLKRLLE